MDVLLGGRGGSKRKRPNDVVGEKIDMFVAPNLFLTELYPRVNILRISNKLEIGRPLLQRSNLVCFLLNLVILRYTILTSLSI